MANTEALNERALWVDSFWVTMLYLRNIGSSKVRLKSLSLLQICWQGIPPRLTRGPQSSPSMSSILVSQSHSRGT
jgi:hypothetical protein